MITRIALGLLLLAASVSRANISEPPRPAPGQITGGPFISKHCVITHEYLEVDLRPLEELGNGLVSATYEFTCDTNTDALQLVFVARNLSDEKFSILLDGQQVDGDTTKLEHVPEHWSMNRFISARGHYKVYEDDASMQRWYSDDLSDYILFTIALDSGQHTLQVAYEVQVPAEYYHTVTAHAFSYILSPALDWKSYSDLNLKIYIPEDWEYSSNLPLTAADGALTGHWKELPHDYFYLVTSMNGSSGAALELGFLWTLWALLTGVVLWRIFIITKSYVNGTVSAANNWTVVIRIVPAAVVLFFFIYGLRITWLEWWYGKQLSREIGHGDGYLYMFAGPALLIVATGCGYVVQALLYAILHARKNKPLQP
jgi:hypothetical protein